MNLLVRLLKTLLLFLLRPRRMGVLDESVVRFRVWPGDLDTNLHMNNGRYMTLLDLGRLDMLLRVGLARRTFRRKWYPVLAAVQLRYRKPLNLFQEFEIRTRIVTWDDRFVYLEQRIVREGRLMTHGYLKGAFVGPRGTVPMGEVVALLGSAPEPPPLPAAFAAWVRAEGAMAEAVRERG
jgi:acyl-CoA thioesterase FadM